MHATGPVVPLCDGILFVHGTTPDQIAVLAETYLADHPGEDEDGWRVITGPVKVGPHHLKTDDEGTQYVPGPGPDGTDTYTGAVIDTLLVNEDTITFRPDGTACHKYAPGQPEADLDALLTPAADHTATAAAKTLRAAHTAIRYRGWTQTEPPARRGPVNALTAIGIGVTGWHYDPRAILSPADETRYGAAITHISRHLGLDAPADPYDVEPFTAWHDAPGRSVDDVLDALQGTARLLEGYRPDRVFTPTADDATGVHHGVALTCYGEDSTYMALGHIRPALMVTASTACHLDLTGEPLAGGTWTQDALEREVRHEWAVHWRDSRGEHWFDFDPAERRTPGSVPVTVLPGD